MNQTETQIFNYLIGRETKFTVLCIEFEENLIEGTQKERERLCKSRAILLAKLVESC